MIVWALDFATGALGLAMLLCTWRLTRGPDAPDRVLALDTMYINAVALIVVLGMRWRSELMFDAALIVALLGFVSTVALARYLTRGDVIE